MGMTLTERQAIEKMMKYIEDERARLWGDYTKLLDRLRELDEIERPTIKIGEVNGPNNLCVEFEGPEDTDDEPEDEPMEENGEESEDTYEEPQSANIPFQQYWEENNIPTIEEPETLIPKEEVEVQKEWDAKNDPLSKKSSRRDIKMISQYIKAILKEAGVPIRTKELITRLEEVGINVSSPYSLLMQAKNYDSNITSPSFGYYQYKW